MLQVRDLSFSFKNRPIVHGLSFSVKSGQLIRIAGPNGAGKSTLMNLIIGLLSGGGGSVEFSGSGDFRLWTSWIAPDANGLSHSLPATDNMRFWLSMRGVAADDATIHAALESWGLAGAWVRTALPVSKFSTGMRRRLALARLELEKSKLWLLDEPLFGLDDNACAIFKKKLKRHIEDGGSALVITHDERLVEGMPHENIQLGGS